MEEGSRGASSAEETARAQARGHTAHPGVESNFMVGLPLDRWGKCSSQTALNTNWDFILGVVGELPLTSPFFLQDEAAPFPPALRL